MTAAPISNDRLRRWAAIASLTTALTLILVKLGAYVLTGSVSLLSSLVDSTVDALASLVTMIGIHYGLQPADRSHRYGHGKSEPLAALGQAFFITGSAVLLCYEAIGRLINPQPLRAGMVGVGVMIFAILATAALVSFQRYVIRRTGSVAIDADSLHYRGDLYMNLAVIAALLLTDATGLPWFDPVCALGIAAFLIHGAWRISRASVDILMDRELDIRTRARISAIVLAHPETRGLHDLRTRSSGDRVFFEFHLELDPHLTLAQAHDITDQVEEEIAQAFPNAETIIHQEPAGLADERLDEKLRRGAGRR